MPLWKVSGWLLSDARLICNSSSFCSDKQVGVLSFQEDLVVKEREEVGIMQRWLCFLVCWRGISLMSDMFWEIYLFSCAICVKWFLTAFLPLSLIYLTTYLPPVVFSSVFLPPFSLPCLSLSLSLTLSVSLSQSLCLQRRPFPSSVYCARITRPSASRMRHGWVLKITDERGTDGCKKRGEGADD